MLNLKELFMGEEKQTHYLAKSNKMKNDKNLYSITSENFHNSFRL